MRLGGIAAAKTFLYWLGLAVVACVGIGGAISLFRYSSVAAKTDTYCFSGDYTAARLALRREANGNLQDWEFFRAQTRRYGFKATDVFVGNPPSAALALAPVAFFDPHRARVIWTWLTVLFWIAGAVLFGSAIIARAGGSIRAAVPVVLCLAVLFEPMRSNLEVAHIYGLEFLLQSACCWLWLERRPAAAGGFAGALLACKGYGVPLIGLAVLRRDWRFAQGAAASFAALAALSGFLLGFRQWFYFVDSHLGASFSGIPTPALQTLKSFLGLALHLPTIEDGGLRVLTPEADRLMFALLAIAFCLLLGWLSDPRVSGVPSTAMLSACVSMSLIFSPRAEDHAYPLAMTAILLLLPELRGLGATAFGAACGTALLSWPFHLQDRVVTGPLDLATDFARLWGALILLATALLAEWRRRRGSYVTRKDWAGAAFACAAGIALVLWYVKPWRDPVRSGPLLAVSRTAANKVTLLRLDIEEREVATVPLSCKGPFGIALAQPRDWLYVTCWDQARVGVVDLRRRRESQVFPASRLPAWVQQREGSDEIWVSNEDAGTVTIYKAGTATVLGQITTGAGASDIVFSDGGAMAWVSNEGAGTVSLIDPRQRRKLRDILVGGTPQGMALTRVGNRLLVANYGSNTVSVVDTATARELAQIPVCAGPVDLAVAGGNGTELGYVACFGDGSLAVVDIDGRRQIQRIAVGEKPFGTAAHPDGRRVYVCVGGSNRLVVIEAGRPSRILRRIRMDGEPLQLAVVR